MFVIIERMFFKNILSNSTIKDFLSLVTNRGLDSLIGIIVIPYLILKIGSIEYGKIVLAQSIAYLGVAFVNFGSDFLILKKIPLYSFYQKIYPVSIFISRIIQLRAILFILYIGFYYYIGQILGISKDINTYILILLVVCLAEIFSVSHLLVVLQDVTILPRISVIRFLAIFIFTYVFVKSDNDGYKYVLFYSFSFFISNLIILLYAFFKYKLHYCRITRIKVLKDTLIQSSPFFISKINLLLSDKLYNILCASFISLSAAALLDISFKILSVIIIPTQILSVVILGRFTMRSSRIFIRRILVIIFFFSVTLFILLLFLKSYILIYYSFTISSETFFTLSIILFSSVFANLSIFIGDNIMVSYSLERYLIKSSLYSSLFIFPCLIFLLIYVDESIILLSFIFLVHKIVEFSLRIYYSWSYIK